PDRLNGQLTLPDITKYRALDADLIDGEHWRKNKYTLLQQSHFRGLGSNGTKNQRKSLPSPFSPFFPCICINIAIT
ncbi:hypothetical protein J9B68_28045, partial [Klebsiella pneumoniae]